MQLHYSLPHSCLIQVHFRSFAKLLFFLEPRPTPDDRLLVLGYGAGVCVLTAALLYNLCQIQGICAAEVCFRLPPGSVRLSFFGLLLPALGSDGTSSRFRSDLLVHSALPELCTSTTLPSMKPVNHCILLHCNTWE